MVRKGGTRERNAEMRDHVPPTAHSHGTTPTVQERATYEDADAMDIDSEHEQADMNAHLAIIADEQEQRERARAHTQNAHAEDLLEESMILAGQDEEKLCQSEHYIPTPLSLSEEEASPQVRPEVRDSGAVEAGPGNDTTRQTQPGPAQAETPDQGAPVVQVDPTPDAGDSGKVRPPTEAELNPKSRLWYLQQICNSVKGTVETWSRLVMESVVAAKFRMPNKGYPLVAANFIKKCSLRVNENDVIGGLKRIRAHCVKHGPLLTGEIGSISYVSLYERLKKEFNGLMTSRMENPTVLRDKRNQRYTEHSINKEAVSMLNVIIKEYLIDHPVNDMTHLAIIYQTAQDCHDIVAYKPYVNRMFELFTGRFFRNLEQKHQVDESQINSGMLIDYWSQMWTKATEPPTGVERYTTELTSYAPMVGFPDRGEFETIIKHTDSWKSPGADGIFNYYIKWLTELHDILHRQTMKVALGEAPLEEWMCRGITYLFPKNDTPTSASQYRPITCMSNLYKITTKCVTEALQREIKIRGLLTENQMGTMRKVQGAKEHALANIAINAAHNCRLYSTWIDITKAFDSVDHVVLEHVIRRLKLPNWMTFYSRHDKAMDNRHQPPIRLGAPT
ncbi:reverse transcriptase [Babesia caballi]|uniref:Reverse transcriptase n=1 Tax=Babesia caballi TaxID=5871 RepID=A0AAV4LY86_BABCB|nr:reverse transcriptase [Babesia caballi]